MESFEAVTSVLNIPRMFPSYTRIKITYIQTLWTLSTKISLKTSLSSMTSPCQFSLKSWTETNETAPTLILFIEISP